MEPGGLQQGVKKGELRAAGMRVRDGLVKGLRSPLPGGLPRGPVDPAFSPGGCFDH